MSAKRSAAWKYFVDKGQHWAECNLCTMQLSYRTSVSNLMKHVKRQHPFVNLNSSSDPAPVISKENNETFITDDNNLLTEIKRKGKSNPTWKYYEILDSDKFEANCKLCGKNIPYETVSDLAKHVKDDHGEKTKDSDDDDDSESGNETETQENMGRKNSIIWQFFSSINNQLKIAQCIFCKKFLSFAGTTTNLKRHLLRRHPQSTRMIVTSDGKMYEVDPESQLDEDEKDPIQMDAVFLEESVDEIPTPKLNVKSLKRKEKKPFKRHFAEISNEQVETNNNQFYEELTPKQPKTTTMGPLDYFGQYVVSLLKEMPKAAADQLQNEIILQIFKKKASLETVPQRNYEITVSENICLQPNELITEPVTVTIRESEETARCVAQDDNINNISSEMMVQESIDVTTT